MFKSHSFLSWTRALAIVLGSLLLLNGCGSPESRLQKAAQLAAAGEHADALELYKKVLASAHGQAWVSSAWLGASKSQEELAKNNDALDSAKKALAAAKGDPDTLNASLQVAEMQALLDDFGGAEKTLEGLGAKAEDDPRRLAVLTKIAQAHGAAPLAVASIFLNLDAVRMAVGKVEAVPGIDSNKFPYVERYVEKGGDEKIKSPDGKHLLWRGKALDGYYLYTSDAAGKGVVKIKDCKNAFQPSWAPDSKRILYSAINWKSGKRSIMLYDPEQKKPREAFGSRKGVGAMAAFSPDGSKIAFTYFGELWMMNSNGIGRTNVNLKEQIKKQVKEAALLAWSRDGAQLAYQPLGYKDIYVITFVRKL
jgi:hypothetical protein